MRLPFELHVALRYLLFHRGRTFLSVITLISIAGVTVGTAALIIALSLMTGFEKDVRERVLRGRAHLNVTSSLQFPFDGADGLLERVEAVPGVAAAGAVLYTPAMVMLPSAGSPAYAEVHGVDPDAHRRVADRADTATDPFVLLARPTATGRNGIVLGEQLASRVNVVTGDLVRVIVPEVHLSPVGPVPRSKTFEVLGTYRSDYFQEDAQRAFVALEPARRMLRAQGRAHWIELRLDDLDQLAPMKARVGKRLGHPWVVVDLVEENRDILRALNTEKLVLFLAIGLIVVVASLNIVSTLILMVTDKVKEIGALSAMGARPAGVALVFVLQGLVIGVVGTSLGLALGSGVSIWLDRYRVIQLNPEVYYLSYVPFAVRPFDLVVVGVVSVLVSLLATVYPSWKAARLDPVEALRYE